MIQTYEFTFELAWKTLKDYLEEKGVIVKFPRDTIKEAFRYELIEDGELWLDMLQKRNLMAHTYDEETAELAFQLIGGTVLSGFEEDLGSIEGSSMNDYGLPDGTVQRLVDVFRKFPEIEEVILFGSRAKGTYKPGSDIDLALRGERCSAELAWKLQGFINEELPIPY